MHIVILGCGRVGSLLAGELDNQGHSVAVVDQDAKAFRKLGSDFGGSPSRGSVSTARLWRMRGSRALMHSQR